ncbi:MAG TPA: hypothetical protein VH815_02875 [Acidobacteriota bacterium]
MKNSALSSFKNDMLMDQGDGKMGEPVRVAIIGDYNPKASHHVMSNESLKHAASALQVEADVVWIPTDEVSPDPSDQLIDFDAIWCSSGSPYKSASGAISAIQYAREQNRPFFAT